MATEPADIPLKVLRNSTIQYWAFGAHRPRKDRDCRAKGATFIYLKGVMCTAVPFYGSIRCHFMLQGTCWSKSVRALFGSCSY
jgi:hypothetical protein